METTITGTEYNRYPSKQARRAYYSNAPVRIVPKYGPEEYTTIVPTSLWHEAEEALREKREREGVHTAA